MASLIEQQIQSLIDAFDRLAQKSDIPAQTVTKVNKALGQLLSGEGVSKNIEQISRSLAILANRIRELDDLEISEIKALDNIRRMAGEITEVSEAYARLKAEFTAGLEPRTTQAVSSDPAIMGIKASSEEAQVALDKLKRTVQEFSSAPQIQSTLLDPTLTAREAALEEGFNKILRERIQLREKLAAIARPARLQDRIAAFELSQQDSLEVPIDSRNAGFPDVPGTGRGRQPQFQNVDKFVEALGSARAVRNFREAVSQLGLEGAEISNVYKDAASGITSVNLTMAKTGEITQRANVRLDANGRVVSDLSTRYAGFGQAISNNIVKVLNWAVALGVVYGSLNRVRELITQTIDIQRELTEVQIATGQSATEVAKVFDQAASIASQTGSSITGVIEGYAEAFAAAGSIEDPAQRSATAQILLRDSMVLAKLAGIEQAEALDTLTGALRQSGQGLDRGITLIDSFVAVSKQANVSINTLASSLAIVGTAADDVGLSFDEVNALAATLAEATKLSADETGNAIRGFVSGFQSASAEQALSSFGIAVRDSNGELRDFVDLTNQLVQLNQAGVISDRNLAEISNIIGGGFRRGSQFATFLDNYARFQELTQTSEGAEGQAAQALQLQLQTLETAITNLGNSFTNLAQTLGEDGGLVELMTSLANTFAGVLDFISDLVSGLGSATPALLAYGTALAFVNSQQGLTLLDRVGGAGGGLSLGNRADLFRRTAGGQIGTAAQQTAARYAPAVIGAGIIAGSAALEGDYEKAGASIAGAIGGTLVAGPWGTLIGSIIGSSLYESLFNFDLDLIGRRIALGFGDGTGDPKEQEPTAEEQFRDSLSGLEEFNISVATAGLNLARGAYDLFAGTPGGRFLGNEPIGFEFQREDIAQLYGSGVLDPTVLDEESRRLLALANAQASVEAVDRGIDVSGIFQDIADVGDSLRPIVEEFVATYVQEQLSLVGRGEVSATDFASSKELASRLGEQASQITVGLEIAGLEDLEPQELIELLTLLREEERGFIVSIVGELIDTQAKIDALNKIIAEEPDGAVRLALAEDVGLLRRQQDEAATKLQEIFPAIRDSASLREAQDQLIPIIDFEGLSPEQIQSIISLGEELQQQYYDELGIKDETADLIKENNQEQLIRLLGETGQEFLGTTRVDSGNLNLAADILGFGGLRQQQSPFGLLDYRGRFNVSDLPGLQSRYNQFRDTVTTAFPQFRPDESDFGVIADDGFGTLHADMTLLNLLMEELIDVNKDQLNGIYNLPTDATVFVPFTGNQLDGATRALMAAGNSAEGAQQEIINAVGQVSRDTQEQLRIGVTNIPTRQERLGPEPTYIPRTQEELRNSVESINQLAEERKRLIEEEGDPYRRPQATALDAATQAVESVREIVTRFQLQIDSNTTLLLDGRVIAAAVKQFLYEDLVRTEGGATVVRTFVVS